MVLHDYVCTIYYLLIVSISALMLLVGWQEGHPACKKLEWGVQTCIWPSWCHCHSLSLASVKSRLVLPFWYQLTWVVPEKGPLNGCVCVIVSIITVTVRLSCRQQSAVAVNLPPRNMLAHTGVFTTSCHDLQSLCQCVWTSHNFLQICDFVKI